MAERLRGLAGAARHREIQSELNWLAESYDRLAERMEENEGLFRGEGIPRPETRDTAARD